MDEQPRPRILDALEERRRRARPRRVGEPNVLSDAATPNVLSTAGGRPRESVRQASAQRVARPADAGSRSGSPAGTGARLPSMVTLIFLAFAALTAVRLIGQFVERLATETPAVTSPSPQGAGPAEPPASGPGTVQFGTSPAEDCTVAGIAGTFAPGVEVWWSAELATEQDADADVLVLVLRDGSVVDREYVPADPEFGRWDTLCASEPLGQWITGTYRLEVWDGEQQVRHAAGEFELTAP